MDLSFLYLYPSILGNYIVSPTEGVTHESPVINHRQDQRWWRKEKIHFIFYNFRYLAYPIALALSLAMFTLSLMVPSELSTEILLGLLFWAGKC